MKVTMVSILLMAGIALNAQNSNVKIEPINFSKVTVTDAFWKPKMNLVATKTLAACIYQTEQNTGRIRNFEKVARNKGEKHEGIFYDDSDVYKAIEAMAYAIKTNKDKVLEAKADEWIDKIASAQLNDGYLNTYYTLTGLDQRWSDMSMHEDYCGGHMIEAAVAYYEATGKRKFLEVAIKWSNYFDSVFGPGKRNWVTGHQELELALVKLYRVTNDQKYLNLADWLLSERGKKHAVGYTWSDWKDTLYTQDQEPVKEQTQITGHAVRAMYLYSGAADVASYTGDKDYLKAMRTVWEDVVFRNMYITGGIGSAGSNEGFSKDFDLPNEQAYCETCASVGMVFWNQRMNSLTGNAEYMDVLERSLYNGALDGLSLSGDKFFYGNPLASNGKKGGRKEWFGTACCPSNIARLIASLGNYIYGYKDGKIFVNLFVGSETSFNLPKGDIKMTMNTGYPWDGDVRCVLNMKKKMSTSIAFRLPGWLTGTPAPGDLYHFTKSEGEMPMLLLNGTAIQYTLQDGYVVIQNEWKDNDVIEYKLPMSIKKITARSELKFNNDRIALQRGPLVYCVEGADNNGKAWNIISPSSIEFGAENFKILEEPVISLVADLPCIQISDNGFTVNTMIQKVRAIPYYAWSNRGMNEMQVWLPSTIKDFKVNN